MPDPAKEQLDEVVAEERVEQGPLAAAEAKAE